MIHDIDELVGLMRLQKIESHHLFHNPNPYRHHHHSNTKPTEITPISTPTSADLFPTEEIGGRSPSSRRSPLIPSLSTRQRGGRREKGVRFGFGLENVQGFDSALNMFVEFGGYSRAKKDFDVLVYNTMISVCGRVNNWIEAEKIWRSTQENGYIGTRLHESLILY
ncbi:hypothetical protein Q3G72_028450 [Acer saccharum]|nr:hypothetical protein Q3G72_028450 [Acer saccharum]